MGAILWRIATSWVAGTLRNSIRHDMLFPRVSASQPAAESPRGLKSRRKTSPDHSPRPSHNRHQIIDNSMPVSSALNPKMICPVRLDSTWKGEKTRDHSSLIAANVDQWRWNAC